MEPKARKILIVDDTKEDRYLLETSLERSGYDVVSSRNGVEAIEKLKKNTVDMIVSDILMPGMDGFQFCRKCKKDDSLKKIPFVFYTATYTDEKDEEFALNLGAEKFLVKPIEPGELLDVLKTVIEDQRSALPVTPKASIEDESIYLSEYNKRLVVKLQKKVLDLEKEMDIRRQMEEDIIKAQKIKSLGLLAGGVAHDFNNFLTIILGAIEIATMSVKPEDEIFNYLTTVEKAALQAEGLSRQLLIFSKGGDQTLETIFISELIRNSTSLALSASNVRCEFDIPKNLWPVEGDKGQLDQVISNIIINSAQAMPKGGVVKVKSENINVAENNLVPLKEGKYVKTTIEDQGTGISHEDLQQIFDPYFTTKEKGSGLGLATCYSIVKKHEGHIDAESEVGVGTSFHFYLPASPKSDKSFDSVIMD